jgi:hypothetical protein
MSIISHRYDSCHFSVFNKSISLSCGVAWQCHVLKAHNVTLLIYRADCASRYFC